MKRNKIMILAIAVLIQLLISNPSVFIQGASVDTPRNETVHMCGYWQNGLSPMNPLNTPNVASGTYFMYMPLFESDAQVYEDYTAPENLIGLVGKSVSWSADGKEINIVLRPEAKWSDGEALDAEDVVWTLNAYNTYRFSDSVAPHVASITGTGQNVKITLNAGYENSAEVFETLLIGANPILPKHIFTQFTDPTYANNWFVSPGFQESWKVTSGPYQPYATTDTGSLHVYKRVSSWWMDGIEQEMPDWGTITWDLPEPMYIASNHFADNFAQSAALTAGEIDLFGGYQEAIWRLIDDNDTSIHTWVEGGGADGNLYYPLVSAMNEIAFNHGAGYPLDQVWFRKGLAAAINYEDISGAASGYLKQASPVWLDSDQPTQIKYYNPTIRAKYDFTPSITLAETILSEGAFKHTDGYWYTKDAPEGAIWSVTNETITTAMDELPDAGINLKLAGWRLYCVNGWSDHMAAMHLIGGDWHDLGIDVYVGYEEYGDFIAKRDTRDYQMYYSSMGNALINTPLNVMQYFTSDQPTRNVTQWYSPDFLANLTVFSTATSDTVKSDCMDAMQDILGAVMPAIPVSVNGYWYTYNEQYWEGWANARDDVKGKFTATGEYASISDYVPPTTHWTTNAYGHHLLVINNLVKGKGAPGPAPWDFTAFTLSIISIGVAAALLRKRR